MNHFALSAIHPAGAAPLMMWLGALAVGTAFVASLAMGAHELKGTATVHDGDTIRVAGHSVRLHGVDAEELSEPHGLEAKRALINIIGDRPVVCVDTGSRSYNRVVATCYVDGEDVGARLVYLGAALDCARYSHGAYRALEPVGARLRLAQKPYC